MFVYLRLANATNNIKVQTYMYTQWYSEYYINILYQINIFILVYAYHRLE